VFVLCALGTFACGPTQVARTVEHRDQATHPGWENLSEAETLDRVLTLPGQVGFLRGVVGAPTTRSITDRITGRPTTVTDYPLTTDLFVGKVSSPFRVRSPLIVRVPGGTLNGLETRFEDAPSLSANRTYYINVRDQGQIAGGNSATTVVVSRSSDVFELVSGTVVGQGARRGFNEDEARFRQHFAQ
jgi:hypothetical protein